MLTLSYRHIAWYLYDGALRRGGGIQALALGAPLGQHAADHTGVGAALGRSGGGGGGGVDGLAAAVQRARAAEAAAAVQDRARRQRGHLRGVVAKDWQLQEMLACRLTG